MMEHHCLVKHASKLMLAIALPLAILLIGVSKSLPRQLVYATTQSVTPPCKFPAIFNFGDSNSDTGGWSAAFGQTGPPHGETFFHAPAGRYSDGRLIIDFIAESLGLPFLDAYLNSMGSNFSHGANFATAGSTIRTQNTTLYSPFSLVIQSHQFRDFQQRSHILRGESDDNNSSTNVPRHEASLAKVLKSLLPRADYFSKALYTFDIGQNDLTSVNFSSKSSDEAKLIISDILDHFKIAIKEIYDEGGRYFWLHNTGPLGCLPYVMGDSLSKNTTQVDQTGCATPLNEVAQSFNRGLKDVVAQLRKDMPLAAITYVDIYSIKYDLISQALNLGFVNPFLVCCGHGGKYNYDPHKRCGAQILENGKQVLVGSCKDPSKRISWDGAHYTEAANKWVFDRLVDGSYSDPPTPLIRACHKQ